MKLNSANINIMVKACRKASKVLIRDFGEIENLQVSVKGPGDFVTMSDKKVEKILIEELKKARPGYSVLSEEIGEIKNDESLLKKYYKTKGYFNVDVKSSYAKNINNQYFQLIFNIDAGKKYFFNDILI